MVVKHLCILASVLLILAQISTSFVIIDPTTGREITVADNIYPNQDAPEEYLSQNIAISPGDFVRGRTSTINRPYLSDNNDNGNSKYELASDQNLDEENFEQLINTNVKNKQAVEDRSGQEYLLPDGTPIYKFFKRNPYGG